MTGDEAIDISKVKNIQYSFSNNEKVGFVFPVYAWNPPDMVIEFVKNIKIHDAFTFSICTFAGQAGQATFPLKKYIKLDSEYGVMMPNNYVLGNGAEKEDVIKKKIQDAKEKIKIIAKEINDEVKKVELSKGCISSISSRFGAFAMNKLMNDVTKFTVNENCNGCGLCQNMCTAQIISIKKGKPVWDGKCEKCLSCINRCPREAVNYGKQTINKPRYYFGMKDFL